jgi:hypothetical protein
MNIAPAFINTFLRFGPFGVGLVILAFNDYRARKLAK